jgi:hypothetical protein
VEGSSLPRQAPEGMWLNVKDDFTWGNFEVEVLNYPTDEVGLLLKKPFKISVISILKNG